MHKPSTISEAAFNRAHEREHNRAHHCVCPGCTLLCDDITFEVRGSTITTPSDCPRCQQWAEAASRIAAPKEPAEECASDLARQIEAIADHLLAATAPVICGLDAISTQAQQLAWKVADLARATISVSLSGTSGGRADSFARHGHVTGTLGETAHRSDLIVCWYCDPMETHPRLFERLSKFERTDGEGNAGPTKVILTVTDRETQTALASHHCFQVDRADAVTLLGLVRFLTSKRSSENSAKNSAKNSGKTVPESMFSKIAAAAGTELLEQAKGMADLLATSSHGTWIGDDAMEGSESESVLATAADASLHRLIRQLNQQTPWLGLTLRGDGNGQSAENVLAAMGGCLTATSFATGVPEAIDLGRGGRGLFSRQHCDYLLLFADDRTGQSREGLPPEERALLEQVPRAILDSSSVVDKSLLELSTRPGSGASSHLVIPVAQTGLDAAGERCRTDGISMGLQALVPSNRPTVERVLEGVLECLARRLF